MHTNSSRQPIELHPSRHKAFAGPAATDAAGISAAIDALNRTFGEFREANDRRLSEVERRGSADVVAVEKVERINGEVGRLDKALREINEALAANRAGLGTNNAGGVTPEVRAYGEAFERYFRRGDAVAELPGLAARAAISTDSNPDGGYVVPQPVDAEISRLLGVTSIMRQLATVFNATADYTGLHNIGGTTAGWVGEKDARAETNTSKLVQIKFPSGELYAMPAATQRMLDDGAVNMAQWLAAEVNMTFAEQEGAAFISGDGVNKPHGILAQTLAEQAAATPWNAVNFIKSGGAGTLGTNPYDGLISLIHSLKSGYRPEASLLMNDMTAASVRKVKDTTGNYLWQPAVVAGQPSSVLGQTVNIDDNMPDIANNAYPIAFGAWKRAYYIVDRGPVTLLRDPYSAKPYVLFYTTKRVGGGVRDHKAYKLLKTAA